MDFKYTKQCFIFVIAWIAYAATYLLRKPLGVIKVDLERELHFGKTSLGWLDTALLLPYAFMQFLCHRHHATWYKSNIKMVLGSLGDKFGARETFGLSLLISAVSMVSFGWWDNYGIMVLLLFINGVAQSQCWPCCTKVLNSWFSNDSKNTVFGLIGTSAFAGGILGTALAVFLQTSYSWRAVYVLPSNITAICGIVVFYWFNQRQYDCSSNSDVSSNKFPHLEMPKPSWKQLWLLPIVPEISIATFCVKLVRYSLYMWLPMYFLDHLQYERYDAGMYSTAFDIGGVLGSTLIGVYINRCFRGDTLLGTSVAMLLSTVCLGLFLLTSHWGASYNLLFMMLAGAFNCGTDCILGGSIPSQIGEKDGRKSGAAVTGLVNGFGSLGAVLEGPLVGWLAVQYSWTGVFYFIITLSFVGTLAVIKAATNQNKTRNIESADGSLT